MTPKPLKLSPNEVLVRYYNTPGEGDTKILAFANRLAEYYLGPLLNPRERHSLAELNISCYAYNALRRAGYAFVDEIEYLDDRQLLFIKSIGTLSAKQIRTAIAQFRKLNP